MPVADTGATDGQCGNAVLHVKDLLPVIITIKSADVLFATIKVLVHVLLMYYRLAYVTSNCANVSEGLPV